MTTYAHLLIIVAAASAAGVRTNPNHLRRRSKIAQRRSGDVQRTEEQMAGMATAFRGEVMTTNEQNGDDGERRGLLSLSSSPSSPRNLKDEDLGAEAELWNELLETATSTLTKKGDDNDNKLFDQPVTEVENEENMGKAERDALVRTARKAASFREQARAMLDGEADDSSSEA